MQKTKHNVYQTPRSDVASDALAGYSSLEKLCRDLDKTWFFSTTIVLAILGGLSSPVFAAAVSGVFIDLMTALTLLFAAVWWLVLDQVERDNNPPAPLIAGMLILSLLLFPLYCYWSRGLVAGTFQLCKLIIYIMLCYGFQLAGLMLVNSIVGW